MNSRFRQLTEDEKMYYREHILKWEKSELTQIKYCEENDLNFNTFSYQRTQILKSRDFGIKEKFIPAEIKSNMTENIKQNNPCRNIILRLKNGCVFELPLDIPEAIFDRLIQKVS